MAKTLTIKIGVGKPKKTYNLKGVTTLKFEDKEKTKCKTAVAYINSHVKSMSATLDGKISFPITMDKNQQFIITLTNCQSLKTIQATVKGKTLKSGTLTDLLNSYGALDFNFAKNGANVSGTFLNDKVNMSTATQGVKINTGNGNDNIKASKYNDTITAGNDKDTIKAGAGNDYVTGGAGNDKIYGEAGNDTIKGGKGNDLIDGGAGDDKLYGEAGNDTIKAGAGYDTIDGGAGDDAIYAGAGDDHINAGKGNDILYFGKNDGYNTVVKGGGTDTISFSGETKIKNIKYVYSGKNLLLISGNTTVCLNGYKSGHSAKYIQVGKTTKTLKDFLKTAKKSPVVPTPTPEPEPTPPTPTVTPTSDSYITVNGVKIFKGTDNADTITVNEQGINRIFAGDGADSITTTGAGSTNYIYGGRGNDTITSGAANDIIYGGGGENTIYLSAGSGHDYTNDKADNTFVFTNIENLNQLTFTGGEQGAYNYIADLTITGYGNSTDSLTIYSFFNTEGYDYSKIKLQAGINGTPVSLYELINKSDLKTSYFTGSWKERPKSPISSPAQYAPQIDSVIYGNTPGVGSHNVLLGTAGGNNIFYSGGTNEGLMGQTNGGFTMIYGGDGDETFYSEGNIIYYDGQAYKNREYLIVVHKNDGTKEIKNGVFYNTAIADEQPYIQWVSSDGSKYDLYYTEDSNLINLAKENDYIIKRGFLSDGTNDIEYVEYINPSILTVEGGGGNDTFYTGYGANGGDGNDTIIGSGIMYGNRGDDKFVLTEEYKDSPNPMYNVYTNSGNDYIDTTEMSNKFDGTIYINFGEGVNTVEVDGKHNINIGIGTTSTFREEEPVSGNIETRYSFQERNTHYTAFVQGEDLYIAANNSNKADSEEAVSYDGKGAGVLIIKGWSGLSDDAKNKITISYRELLATTNYTSSTYTIKEFLKIIDGTSESFIGNGRHTYMDGDNERINETYTFNVINNSNGALSTINENGETQVATRNTYDGWGQLTGTEQRSVDYFIIGGNGAQTINGGEGNDVIYGDNPNGHDNDGHYIYATADDGNDIIYGGKGNDYIIGGSGNDTIHGGSGTDYLDGGEGNDFLVGGTLGEEEEFNKSLLTSRFNLKEIHGGNGNDTVYSLGAYTNGTFDEANSKTYLGGNTYFTNNIYAGDGNDEIHANAYRDVVYAGKGNDIITSYAENNDLDYNSDPTSEIYGEEGNDHIILKSHADVRAYGGDGDDIIDAREATVRYYNMLYGDNGNDTIYGSNGYDIIYTGLGDNRVEAGDGNDDIYGSEDGDNVIYAGDGNDYIKTSGTSTIYGGAGNDTIYIAMGHNYAPSNLYIDGGTGDDTYIADGEYGYDTIVASSGNDVIKFKAFVKANTSYQYNGNDLVLSYNTAGLILKDYKLNGFSDFTIKTYDGYAQNGQYSMADFISYLDGNYSMATTATDGDDIISATGNIDALGGNDFILAHSTTSTYDNPQVINTGSGNNSVLAQADYSSITGGTGNDEYNLQSSIATLVDEGGNDTITVARFNQNVYYDITLNGDGNNIITSAPNTDAYAYKITATGSGKQTIDINSAEYRNHPETNEQLFTSIKTGSGDDEISLYLGTVESGAGEDTITVKNGANSGSYYTSGATLKGEEGNDTYIIEGGYDWQSENGISVNLKALIADTQGANEIKFTSPFMSHDNLNLLLNVQADGTLAEFKHSVNNPETGENDIEGTGYSAFICGNMDLEYAGNVSHASCNGWDVCDGVRFADSGTVSAISRIEAYDGYYISQETLSTMKSNAVAWLLSTENGKTAYASVWDAIKPNGQNDFNSDNYNALYAIFNNENTWTQV